MRAHEAQQKRKKEKKRELKHLSFSESSQNLMREEE